MDDWEVNDFVEKAIAKELGEHDEKLESDQEEFQKRLIMGYKRDTSRSPDQEDKIWEEVGIEDS